MWWCGNGIFERFRKEVMGARLLLAEGKVQKSPEGVVHLMAEHLVDRSADLRLLSGDALPPHAAHATAIPAMCGCCRRRAIFIDAGLGLSPDAGLALTDSK